MNWEEQRVKNKQSTERWIMATLILCMAMAIGLTFWLAISN